MLKAEGRALERSVFNSGSVRVHTVEIRCTVWRRLRGAGWSARRMSSANYSSDSANGHQVGR
jgi:hypothetical protein